MSVPTINPLPQAPNPTSSPATFDADVTNFLGALPGMVTQTNALGSYLEGRADTAESSASTASSAAATATTRASTATQAAADAQTARNTAQAAAAAAQSSAGLPSLVGNARKRLVVNAGATGVGWEAGSAPRIVFTESGTLTKEPDDLLYIVKCIGGGGSGSRGTTSGGGSGGECVEAIISASDVTSTVTVTVAEAVAGPASNGNGSPGGSSSFGPYVTARGGNAGQSGGRFATPAGAAVTSVTTADGQALLLAPPSGYGSPTLSYRGGHATTGGAGGGAGAGSNASLGGLSTLAGNGGNGASGGNGGDGVVPGGGGGGAYPAVGNRGGNGARGQVEVIRIKG